MRALTFILALTLPLYGNTIEGVGYGLTKDAAIEQAKRDAVEIGLGAYISSETVVTATSLTDNIYSKAQGFVKTFKVLSESKGPDGNWEVTISAEVTAILDEVMQDEAALQTLLSSMNRPRIIFLVREENLIDNVPTDFAETKLLSLFYEKGFDVVDRQLVQALKGEPDYENALSGNVSAAAKVASQLGADIIVIGTAKVSSGGIFYGMTSGQAGVNAMNEAAGKLGTEIIRQLIEKWSTAQSNFVKCYIVLKNADFMSYTMFETFLKAQTVSGIKNAYSKSLNDGVAEYEIEFEGKAMDLAMGLSKTQPDGFNIKVTGITGNRITAEVAQ